MSAKEIFNNNIFVTLAAQSARANLSSSEEDLAVQMGKIQKWFNDFSWAVWNAPFGETTGSGNAVTSVSVIGPNDTDDPSQIGKVRAWKGETFIPRDGMVDIGMLCLGNRATHSRFGSIWATDVHDESNMTDYQTPLLAYEPHEYDPGTIVDIEPYGDIQIGYVRSSSILGELLNDMNLFRSTDSYTYHHVGNTIISTGYKSYYTYSDGKRTLGPVVPNKTISVVIPAEYDDDNDSWGYDTYAGVWNSFFCSFDGSSQVAFNNQYKDFIGDDVNFLIVNHQAYFKVFSTGYQTGPATYNNKSYTYATASPGIAFSINNAMGMLQIATAIDDHQDFPAGSPDPGTLIISGGEYTHDTVTPGTPIVERHPDFAWGIHGTSGTVYDLDNLTATKLGTSTVGSSVRPIYLNAGVPTGVTQPTSGAWWSSVPKIDSSGVLEIGKYIDFHATAASTNNYDYRLYVSTNTLTFQSVSSEYTQVQLTSVGSSMIRFATTASGKTCSAAKVAAYPLNTSGQVILLESGGNTVIGSGEFASNAYSRKNSTGTNAVGYDNLATAETEDLYLGADSDVHIIANGQNIGTYSNTDHKEWLFNASGELNCPDAINIMKGAAGVRLKDKSGALYAGIWDNGSNLWIGSTQSAATHHVGGTFISTGYDSTNHRGNSSINLVVPNDTNDGYSASWVVLHTGNKSLLSDTYVPLAGGSMNNDVTLTFPRTSGGSAAGGTRITSTGFNFQVPTNTGFSRAITTYRGDWSTVLGAFGFYGSSTATADDVEYYMGPTFKTDPWYSFKKTQFTVKGETNFKIDDSNDAGWSLIYKSSTSTINGQVISCYPSGSQYANGLIIGETSGGLTIVGGGEAAYALNGTIRNASTTPWGAALSYETESLIMGADTDLYFVSGANSLTTSAHTEGTNLKTFIWSNGGTLRPWNDDTYSIGAAAKRWNYGYFTNISGKLIGTIDSSTTATTQTLPNVTSRVATCQFAWNLFNNSGYFANDNTGSTPALNNPWGCIAQVTVSNPGSGTWTYISTTFLIMAPWVDNPGSTAPNVKTGPGTGILLFRASIDHTSATLSQYTLKWLASDENVNDKFIVLTSTKDTTNNTLTIKIWAYCPNRYMGYHIHPLYEATRAGRRTSEIWTYNSITTGVANYDTGSNVTVLKSTSPQTLLYESAASVATSLECTVSDIFLRWNVVYVCVQDLSFGSGSNPISINFLVPLRYVKAKSNYNAAISASSNPGYYAGEGYNPSNTSGATRMLVQWKDDSTIVFTHGSGNRIGTIRIYGIS